MRQDSKIRKRLFFTHFFGWVAAAICSHRMTTSLRFGFDDLHAEIARVEATLPSTTVKTPRSRPDRPSLPAHLPREDMRLDLEHQACPCCGGELHVIGETVSEMLDHVPARLRVSRALLWLAEGVTNHQHNEPSRRFRRVLALPIYAVALLLSFASDLFGDLAAKIAGDDVGG
jgi:hypothetical protein